MKQDDQPVNEMAESMRSHIEGGLRGATDRVVSDVQERGNNLFDGRLYWLGPLWGKVKGLPATTQLISACWKGHVDGVATLKHRKADTKAATAFTLTRFAGWEDKLRVWMNDPEVLEAGFNSHREETTALHYLSCIINQVEEVGCLCTVVSGSEECMLAEVPPEGFVFLFRSRR